MSARLALPPFPTGWFCVGFAWEIGRRPQLDTWCGRSIELSRDEDGRARGRCFSDDQPCVLVEQQDAVFLWHDEDGRPPLWTLPHPDPEGWSSYAGHCWPELRSHPQETTENSVDTAHFSVVHGYPQVEVIREAAMEGPELRARYAIVRDALPIPLMRAPVRAEFDVLVSGLGYSLVENEVAQYGLKTRQTVFPTPRDGKTISLRIATSVRSFDLPGPIGRLATWMFRRAVLSGYASDVRDDFDIWEHKTYLDQPRPVQGDGPIGRYRSWVRQFYPELAGRRRVDGPLDAALDAMGAA